MLKMIELTHANTDKPAQVIISKIFGFYFSDTQKCTLVLSDAGAVFPVSESVEEINNKINNPIVEGEEKPE